MQEGQVVTSGLLVTGGNAPVVFDAIEKPLDLISVRIQVGVNLTLDRPVLFWRDDRFSLKGFDVRNELITVKAFVANHRPRLQASKQRFCLGDVGSLARCQNEAQRVS